MPGPHELFARFTFGHPERAAAELRAALPPHVVSEVDWSSLRRESGSVVDPELRETESELLFTARLREGPSPLLDDLTAERAEALMARPGPPLARLAWLVLRYGRTGELAQRPPDWTVLFAQGHVAPGGTENLLVIIRYLIWVGLLAARGVLVSDEAKQRILTCTDVTTLDRWFARALNATILSEVLDDLAS